MHIFSGILYIGSLILIYAAVKSIPFLAMWIMDITGISGKKQLEREHQEYLERNKKTDLTTRKAEAPKPKPKAPASPLKSPQAKERKDKVINSPVSPSTTEPAKLVNSRRKLRPKLFPIYGLTPGITTKEEARELGFSVIRETRSRRKLSGDHISGDIFKGILYSLEIDFSGNFPFPKEWNPKFINKQFRKSDWIDFLKYWGCEFDDYQTTISARKYEEGLSIYLSFTNEIINHIRINVYK